MGIENDIIRADDTAKMDVPNEVTLAAFCEGEELLKNPKAKGYTSIADLREALEV